MALAFTVLAGCGDRGGAATDAVDASADAASDAADGTSSDAADTGAGDAGLCEPGHGPIAPVGTSDTTYTAVERTDCLSAPCTCAAGLDDRVERLLACDAIAIGWYEGLGSAYFSVAGRDGGDCLIDVGSETEGGVAVHRCRLPLPVSLWTGLMGALDEVDMTHPLEGIEDRCTLTSSCCVLSGCPNPCTGAEPLCPSGRSDPCPE
ncbi:MAG: hypothetical protein U1F43_16150 [Myxococcota bacterium]